MVSGVITGWIFELVSRYRTRGLDVWNVGCLMCQMRARSLLCSTSNSFVDCGQYAWRRWYEEVEKRRCIAQMIIASAVSWCEDVWKLRVSWIDVPFFLMGTWGMNRKRWFGKEKRYRSMRGVCERSKTSYGESMSESRVKIGKRMSLRRRTAKIWCGELFSKCSIYRVDVFAARRVGI
jgi:hypothetical protein